MGEQTIPSRSDAQVVEAGWFNVLKQALAGVFVGRDTTTGAPLADQDLGSVEFPWGNVRCRQIIANGVLLDVTPLGGESHKIVSGKKRTTSNQPAFLTPAGAGNGPSFTLDATPTALTIEASGESGSFTVDKVVNALATAPSTNNTCELNAPTAVGQNETRTWGEPEDPQPTFNVDNMGSEITALIGQYAAFKVFNGVSDEYFLAYVESANVLRGAYRGFFYGNDLAPINRIALSDDNPVFLMQMHWVFADVDGDTVATTSKMPKVQVGIPAGAATNDYWFDLSVNAWKRYDGAVFQVVDRVLIGVVVVDETDCVAARCFDFAANYQPDTSIKIESTDEGAGTIIQATRIGQRINVAGNYIKYPTARPTWDATTDLADAEDMYDATMQADRFYYFYITDSGAEVISDISPYHRGDLSGWYHPHNPWRCVGKVQTNASALFDFDDRGTPIRYMIEGKIDEEMIENDAIVTRHIKNGAVTREKREPTNAAVSLSSGGFSSSSTSYVQVTNLSVAITLKGGAARITLEPEDFTGTDPQGINTFTAVVSYRILRDGAHVISQEIGGQRIPLASISLLDTAVIGLPGTFTYTMEVKTGSGSDTVFVNRAVLKVVEV